MRLPSKPEPTTSLLSQERPPEMTYGTCWTAAYVLAGVLEVADSCLEGSAPAQVQQLLAQVLGATASAAHCVNWTVSARRQHNWQQLQAAGWFQAEVQGGHLTNVLALVLGRLAMASSQLWRWVAPHAAQHEAPSAGVLQLKG